MSGSRKNTSTKPEEVVGPVPITEELMEQRDKKGKVDEGTSTSTQPPPDTKATSTQPPPTATTQPPIFTSSSTTIHVTMSVSTPTDTFATASVTSPPLIQKTAPVMNPTTERVTIYNIEFDSDQEDQQPIIQLAQRKNLQEKQSAKGQKEQDELDDEHDERFVLTPLDQEIFFKEIEVEGGLKEIDKANKGFEDEVSERLGELNKQQQLNIDMALQKNQAQQSASTQDVQILEQEEGKSKNKEEEKDEGEEQLQKEAITEEPGKTKKVKTIQHFSRSGSGEVIADITAPIQVEGGGSPKYQVSQVGLGKQTKWGELDTFEFSTNVVRRQMENEHSSQAEVKA
ncbi:uncharacterized protein LOC131875854 [Cryptomeria japonica]|uniref:uncharacterized protein LOC131875854 n=1 Tax=Cryptomeria japonica TaxID=3369 RepID=UPI0027DA00FF|nr:uncharacterized protein LOC131875854 [Cryptomeria japonica]